VIALKYRYIRLEHFIVNSEHNCACLIFRNKGCTVMFPVLTAMIICRILSSVLSSIPITEVNWKPANSSHGELSEYTKNLD